MDSEDIMMSTIEDMLNQQALSKETIRRDLNSRRITGDLRQKQNFYEQNFGNVRNELTTIKAKCSSSALISKCEKSIKHIDEVLDIVRGY